MLHHLPPILKNLVRFSRQLKQKTDFQATISAEGSRKPISKPPFPQKHSRAGQLLIAYFSLFANPVKTILSAS